MPHSPRFVHACIALLVAAPAAATELYKWVDEKGVVNYSNEPPPKGKGGKPATVVEDRTSVYTPDKAVVDALERSKERLIQQQPVAATPPGGGVIAAPPPPPPAQYDPCATPGDPNCQVLIYDGSPVFAGRRRPPHLVQPQLPPGTIAGQATASGGTIPGLSGVTPPASPPGRPLSRRDDRDREIERAPLRR